MATLMRHGGETHVVRPDRVYRTSVLTPIVGYQPQVDVQAVARAFTQGPPLGTMLQGFGNPGFWDRVRAFFRGRKIEKAVAKAVANGEAMIVPTSPGPATVEASQVAPQMQSQMTMLAHLMQQSNAHIRGPLAAAAFQLQTRRPLTWYRAG